MSQDRELQQAVLAEVQWDPGITANDIGVVASGGVITLTGHVPNYLEKECAEKAAARVHGVKAVAQEIEVRLPVHRACSDADIARAALDHLAWTVSVPADAVAIEVDAGWVILTGEVTWHYQREAAERVVRSLRGVVGVANRITLKPSTDVLTIADDIATALHRSWAKPSTITVSAINGKVTLTGTVATLHEKQKAATTAWAAPGTTDVANELVVVG